MLVGQESMHGPDHTGILGTKPQCHGTHHMYCSQNMSVVKHFSEVCYSVNQGSDPSRIIMPGSVCLRCHLLRRELYYHTDQILLQ